MYYTDDSILPENMAPLIITVAPFGPQWLPGEADIPVTWDEQVQTAVDCWNAGATVLHVHVRNPATGKVQSTSNNTTTSSGCCEGRAENDFPGRRLDLVFAKDR